MENFEEIIEEIMDRLGAEKIELDEIEDEVLKKSLLSIMKTLVEANDDSEIYGAFKAMYECGVVIKDIKSHGDRVKFYTSVPMRSEKKVISVNGEAPDKYVAGDFLIEKLSAILRQITDKSFDLIVTLRDETWSEADGKKAAEEFDDKHMDLVDKGAKLLLNSFEPSDSKSESLDKADAMDDENYDDSKDVEHLRAHLSVLDDLRGVAEAVGANIPELEEATEKEFLKALYSRGAKIDKWRYDETTLTAIVYISVPAHSKFKTLDTDKEIASAYLFNKVKSIIQAKTSPDIKYEFHMVLRDETWDGEKEAAAEDEVDNLQL